MMMLEVYNGIRRGGGSGHVWLLIGKADVEELVELGFDCTHEQNRTIFGKKALRIGGGLPVLCVEDLL
ncbi:hypothetical protein ACOSQ2_025379 [Xanthoceras sorbifolium]